MPISPLVQQYQRQMSGEQGQPNKDEKSIFNSKFGETAYKTFTSKNPQLVEYIVTFKVIESDTENGRGLGAFILRYGNDVLYVPTVLNGSGISSCEMIYDKKEDNFYPLIKSIVNDIVNKNKLRDPKILDKQPHVDSTRDMFKNMFRPPSSTNPVFASGAGIESLPDKAKERVSNYFQSNPDLLAKVAEFYPVKALASKLAKTGNTEKVAAKDDIPDVIGLDTITKEAVDNLSDEDKQTVLRDGFLVGKKDTTDYIPGNELISTLVTRYDIAHKDLKNLYGTGKIIVFDPIHGSVEFLPALFTPEKVIYKYNGEVKFVSSHYGSALVAEFENYISESDLLRFGAQSVTLPDHSNDIIMIFYPTKADNFYKACVIFKPNGSWQVMDEDVKIITENITDSVIFSNDIAHGKVGNILPYDSYYIPLESRGEFKLINNFDEFLKLVDGLGVNIRLYNDGAGVTVTDSHNKTASLPNSNTKIAEYLTSEYDLGHDSIKALLDNKELFVLRKEAASPFAGASEVQHGSETIHEVYPEIIDDTIDIGDDDLVETGMIASVADEEEVTPIMVDMMPRFIETSTDLGKTILLMNYDEESFEDFYGTEEYNNLLNKCRRVFKTIGELMSDLRKYINMN